MGKKSFLDKVTGKKSPETVESTPKYLEIDNLEAADDVDHKWMKEGVGNRKPKLERNGRIDTEILRGRIAEKIAKLNNN